MKSLQNPDGLEKLNPRSLPQDKELPSSIQKFLNKATPSKPTKLQTTLPHKKQCPKPTPTISHPSAKVSKSLYLKQLEYSRNYSKYIDDYETGKTREDVFPDELPEIPKKIGIEINEEKSHKDDSSALIRHLIRPKEKTEKKRASLKGHGLLQKPMVWCARCSKRHAIDFHAIKNDKKKEIKLPVKRERFEGVRKQEEVEDEYWDEEEEDDDEEEEDSFIEKDDGYENVTKMVRSITGFDPRKYKEIDRLSTKGMESSASQILNEERYTAKIAKIEDQRELELENRRKLKKQF